MAKWTWKELETLWRHPDWTARELSSILNHTPSAINKQRSRVGRYQRRCAPLCCKCDERVVWMESPAAQRYGLCKSCYLDEERMRLEDDARHAALRQRMRRARKKDRDGCA